MARRGLLPGMNQAYRRFLWLLCACLLSALMPPVVGAGCVRVRAVRCGWSLLVAASAKCEVHYCPCSLLRVSCVVCLKSLTQGSPGARSPETR